MKLKLKPSRASTWLNCRGQPATVAKMPYREQDETAAEEGKDVHAAAEAFLHDRDVSHDLTEEGLCAAKAYAEVVKSYAEPRSIVGVEAPIEIPFIHPSMSGVVDAYVYNEGHLHIFDLKYGYLPVEAEENPQLAIYACGLQERMFLSWDTSVTLHIIQPRAFTGPTVKSWETTLEELRPLFERIRDAAHAAYSRLAPVSSGPHCRYCPARHACPASWHAGASLYEAVESPAPLDLGPEELSHKLTLVSTLKKRLEYIESGLQAEVSARIKDGQAVPGYTLEWKPGKRFWKDPGQVLALGRMVGVDLATPLSPAKLEKTAEFPRNLRDTMLSEGVERKSTLKLTKVTHDDY